MKWATVLPVINCDYCSEPAELKTGNKVYPHRPELESKLFWVCEPCRARVGCHPGTTKPLGRLANSQLRYWKQQAHRAFDPIWRDGGKKRSQAYRWLAREMKLGRELCHIGMFSVDQCKQVVDVCLTAELKNKTN